ncbi:MAG: hypothetical protein KatS3mg076_3178 [Candidatus Binatia bacterium]|nr:MAG: hypothetical protein KatS3mg076_3178 [Candidatus Binatia bacterium]
MREKRSQRTVVARIVGASPVRLWGLSSDERLRRQLDELGVRTVGPEKLESSGAETVVLVRGDYLFDSRVLQALVGRPGTALRALDSAEAPVVAVHVPLPEVRRVLPYLEGELRGAPEGLDLESPATLVPSRHIGSLRKAELPVVVRISEEKKELLERHLFEGAYKGITDLITKWVWPRPARWVTGLCVRWGISPDAVTWTSLALVLLATGLFLQGSYGPGLLVAWFMTFLDTVDGKLARVTVRSSRFGHFLDHGIDVLHPPVWYVAWGLGLPATEPRVAGFWLEDLLAVIVVAYVAGRLCEGAFSTVLAPFEIFSWRPVDSYFRLVMARRNPNLLLLTGAALMNRPDLGVLAVAVWTSVSAVFLAARLVWAGFCRWTSGPLVSWLENVDPAAESIPCYARPFVRRAELAAS